MDCTYSVIFLEKILSDNTENLLHKRKLTSQLYLPIAIPSPCCILQVVQRRSFLDLSNVEDDQMLTVL